MEASGLLLASAALPLGKNLVSIHRRLGGPQSHSGCFAEEKNVFNLLGFEPWSVQSVT